MKFRAFDFTSQLASKHFRHASLAACLLWLPLGIAYVFFGCYVGDEGWYCLIAREVWKGRALYSDVRFTQMPLVPYLYGAWLQLLPARIESARILSLLCGFGGLLFTRRVLRERFGEASTLPALGLALCSAHFAFDISSVRTQALSFLLSSSCLWFCHRASQASTRDARFHRALSCAALFAGLAVAARLSFVPLLLLPAWIGFFAQPSTARSSRRAHLWQSLGVFAASLLLPLALALFYFFRAREKFIFGITGFHALLGRSLSPLPRGELPNALRNAVVFAFNDPLWALAWSAVASFALLRWARHEKFTDSIANIFSQYAFEIGALLVWFGITLIHVSRRPAYPTYQTPLVWAPMLALALTLSTLTREQTEAARRRASASALVLIGALGAWAAWSQGSALFWRGSDRARTPAGVYDLAAPLRARPGKTLVTFESGLAFCAPRIILPQGYEMAEFSLVPPLPAARQEYLRGISFRRLQRDVARADFLALRPMDYSHLHLSDQRVSRRQWDALFRGFAPVARLDSYGQYGTPLVLWRRRAPR